MFYSNVYIGNDIALSEVQRIEVATNNGLIPGTLLGTAVGTGAMLILESILEEPSTSSSGSITITTTYTMPTETKIAIIFTGFALGMWLGSKVKTGYKEIYPNRTFSDRLSMHFACARNKQRTPMLGLMYQF
ncbi:hypothetical protein JXO59_15420 [candidate division KSB1 bacterium]|nr:hypothetical protein [candidate division KSB1 bacterium]